MTTYPSHALPRVLITGHAVPQHDRISKALYEYKLPVDLVLLDVPGELAATRLDSWDAIVLTPDEIAEVLLALPDADYTPPLIVLHPDEAAAHTHSIRDIRIASILPLSAIHRLPVVLEREFRLRQALSRHREVVNRQQEMIVCFSPDLRITFTNPAYCQKRGRTAEDLLGSSLFEQQHNLDHAPFQGFVDLIRAGSPSATVEHKMPLPDGAIRWIAWNIQGIFAENDTIIEYQCIGRDITETKQAQERLNLLHALIVATSTANSLEAALRDAMRIVCETQGWEYGEIWLPDESNKVLNVSAVHYVQPEQAGVIEGFWEDTQNFVLPRNSGIPGRAWASQTPSWTVDIQEMTQQQFLRLEHAIEAGIHGIVAIPIMYDGQVLAVMVFMALRKLPQDDELLRLINTPLQQIAPIIRNQQITSRLVESEEKYRTLVQNFDGVITIADAGGRYLFANDHAWAPFNLPPDEREGKSVHDLFPPEVADLFVKRVREVIETGKAREDIDEMLTGSEMRWFQSTIVPLKNPDGTITRVQSIAFDVTASRRAEAQLRQAQEIAHLGSWSLDFRTNETRWSDEFFRICGFKPGSVKESQELRLSLIHPDDRERAEAALEHTRRTGVPYHIEKRIVRPSGELRWVISQGQVTLDQDSVPVTMVGTFLDITPRKEAQQALERTLARLSVLHALDQSILGADSLQHIASGAAMSIARLMQAQRVSVALIDEEKKQAQLLATHSQSADTRLPEGTLMTDLAQEIATLKQEPYVILTRLDQHPAQSVQAMYAEGIRSILSIGLKQGERLIGALNIHADSEDFFGGDRILIPLEIADQLAIAIHTVQLNEKIRQHNEELEDRVRQRTNELELEKTRTEAILQSSSDGIVLLDDSLHIQTTNRACIAMLGGENVGCVGSALLDHIHPDDRDPLREQLQQALNDDTARLVEARAMKRDGQAIHVEMGISRVRQINGNAPYLVCAIRDVTARKQAEARLAASEQRYRTTLAAMSEGIVLQRQDGEIQLVNAAAARILGLTVDEITGRTSLDPRWQAVHEDGTPFPGEKHPAMVALQTGERVSNVMMGVSKPDSSLTWIQINAEPLLMPDAQQPYAVVSTFADVTDQKQAHDALLQSEARYRALFEQSNDGVFILDVEEGRHLFVNQRGADMLGYNPDELINLSFRDISHPNEVVQSETILDRLLKGERVPIYERRVMRRDGSPLTVEINVELVRDEQGKPMHIQSIMRDISDRKQAELAVKASEEKYRSLIKTMHSGFALIDVENRFSYVNDQLCEMLGYSADELVGHATADVIHTTSQPKLRKEISQRRQGTVGNYEVTAIRKDGTPINVLIAASPLTHADGHYTGSSVVVTNITPIREIQARLQLATNAGGIGIWDWDIKNDALIWDQQMYQMYGIGPHQNRIDLATFEQSLHPLDHDRVLDTVNVTLRDGEPFAMDFRIIRPDGTLRHIRTRAFLQHDAEGKPERMIGVNYDISQIREAEIKLREALEQEQELGELKSRFVSMASHEFRTPLATISATAETLIAYRDRFDGPQLDARLNKILDQVTHMKDIMEDVLQLARIQSGHLDYHPEAGDLDKLCREIIEEFETRPENRGRLRLKRDAALLKAVYDPRLMRHVFSNLISNALKYSPTDQPVALDLYEEENGIIFRVTDHGIGIPEADLKHLFEPFHRASNVGTISGTGLGLSITKEAVDLHGGSIQVETRANQNTTFTVTIPRATSKQEAD